MVSAALDDVTAEGRVPQEDEVRCLEAKVSELEREIERLQKENQELKAQHERDQKELAELREKLGKEKRAGKRQAAPFSKGKPKEKPKRPGRKPGADYGKKANREAPKKEPDEVLDAHLPETCPGCNGTVHETEVKPQFQLDLPPNIEPWLILFDVHIGECDDCGQRVQGRHPLQISDALGAAASLLGPRALALSAELKITMGLSYGKISEVLQGVFGIAVTAGALSLNLQRMAKAAKPTYEALKQAVRNAPIVSPDETGWRVNGLSAWLWVFATTMITVYAIEPGRGYIQAAKVLGEDFKGVLVRDGWAAYRRFKNAIHQTCLNHLLRRCRENLESAKGGTARLPHGIRRILKDALKLRDRRDAGSISPEELKEEVGRLRADMKRYLSWNPIDEENRKFVKHLNIEENALFTFLENPGVPATNHWAEQDVRPMIPIRKNSGGGNRSWKGAEAVAILGSVFRTARRQGRNPRAILIDLLRSRSPALALELLPEAARPPTAS